MKLLFIADPLADFKISKDSTYAMMQEAQARGWSVAACELHDMHWQAPWLYDRKIAKHSLLPLAIDRSPQPQVRVVCP